MAGSPVVSAARSADDLVPVDTASGRVAVRPTVPARAVVGLVRLYQRAAAGRPSPCRYVPSCSTYAVEALQVHGALRGTWFAVRRVSRCHPWGGHGHDPVPDPADHPRSH